MLSLDHPWFTGILFSCLDTSDMRSTAEACGRSLAPVISQIHMSPSIAKECLVLASASGRLDLVKMFVRLGAKISRGWDPSITVAARNEHLMILEWLMRHRGQQDPRRQASILMQCIRPWGRMTRDDMRRILLRC